MEGASFERIAMPGSGGQQFKRETAGGVTHVDSITGVIVLNESARVYFQPGKPLGGTPPLCSSRDNVYGFGDPGDQLRAKGEGCVSCPMSQRGTGKDGNGSACKELRLLGLIEDGRPIAAMLRFPPTSLSALDRYAIQLFNEGFQLSDVATTISLSTREVSGFTVAVPVFKVAGVLDDESREYASNYTAILRESARKTTEVLKVEGRQRPSAEQIDRERSEANAYGGPTYEDEL